MAVRATPRESASSEKVPSRRLIHRWFAAKSLAMKMSGQPSPSKSATTIPSPGPGFSPIRELTVTSSNDTARRGTWRPDRGCGTICSTMARIDPESNTPGRTGRGAACGGIVVDIVDNAEVEPAIAVVIEERCGRGPLKVDETGFRRHVDEAHASLVQQQFHAVHLGDEEIGLAVVVDVAHRDAHVPAGEIEPRAWRHILKGVIRFLSEDFVGAGRLGTGVGEEDQVEQSVAIQVHDGAARAHVLIHEVLRHIAGVVDEVHAGAVGDVFEPHWTFGNIPRFALRFTCGRPIPLAATDDWGRHHERATTDEDGLTNPVIHVQSRASALGNDFRLIVEQQANSYKGILPILPDNRDSRSGFPA